MQGHIIR
jgi:hypothetical protein